MKEMCRLKEYMERASFGLFAQKGVFFPLLLRVSWGDGEDTTIFVFVIPTFPVSENYDTHRHWSFSHQSKPTINPMFLSKLVTLPQLPPPHTTLVSPPCPRELWKAFCRGWEEGKAERAQCCCVRKWQIEPARQCPQPWAWWYSFHTALACSSWNDRRCKLWLQRLKEILFDGSVWVAGKTSS